MIFLIFMLTWDMFRKGKTFIISKFHRTDSVICHHSREWKTLPYSQINTIVFLKNQQVVLMAIHLYSWCFTKKSYSKQLELNVVYIPVTTLSHMMSVMSK